MGELCPSMLRMCDDTRSQIIFRFESYIRAAKLSERQFGIDAVGDHKLLKRLRDGRGVTLTVIARAEDWICQHPVDSAAGMSGGC